MTIRIPDEAASGPFASGVALFDRPGDPLRLDFFVVHEGADDYVAVQRVWLSRHSVEALYLELGPILARMTSGGDPADARGAEPDSDA